METTPLKLKNNSFWIQDFKYHYKRAALIIAAIWSLVWIFKPLYMPSDMQANLNYSPNIAIENKKDLSFHPESQIGRRDRENGFYTSSRKPMVYLRLGQRLPLIEEFGHSQVLSLPANFLSSLLGYNTGKYIWTLFALLFFLYMAGRTLDNLFGRRFSLLGLYIFSLSPGLLYSFHLSMNTAIVGSLALCSFFLLTRTVKKSAALAGLLFSFCFFCEITSLALLPFFLFLPIPSKKPRLKEFFLTVATLCGLFLIGQFLLLGPLDWGSLHLKVLLDFIKYYSLPEFTLIPLIDISPYLLHLLYGIFFVEIIALSLVVLTKLPADKKKIILGFIPMIGAYLLLSLLLLIFLPTVFSPSLHILFSGSACLFILTFIIYQAIECQEQLPAGTPFPLFLIVSYICLGLAVHGSLFLKGARPIYKAETFKELSHDLMKLNTAQPHFLTSNHMGKLETLSQNKIYPLYLGEYAQNQIKTKEELKTLMGQGTWIVDRSLPGPHAEWAKEILLEMPPRSMKVYRHKGKEWLIRITWEK